MVRSFREKSNLDNARINGGYMVVEPAVFDYLKNDSTIFESKPMEKLASEGNWRRSSTMVSGSAWMRSGSRNV